MKSVNDFRLSVFRPPAAVLVALFCLAFGLAPARADTPIGTAVDVKPQADAVSGSTTTGLVLNAELFEGQTVVTGAAAKT